MDEKNNQIIDETNKLLNTFKDTLVDCVLTSKQLLDRINNNEFQSTNGNTLFDLKNQTFLNYLIDLTDIVKCRLKYDDNNDAVRERIIEKRIVLEKIQPLEDKLKYQVDNLMKILNTNRITNQSIGKQTTDDNNPLNARPNFSFDINDDDNEQMDEQQDSNDETIDDKEKVEQQQLKQSLKKNQVYVPPRLAQMKFEDEQERKVKNLERAKKRAINSSIMNELRKEFDDTPEEEYINNLMNRKSGIGKFLNQKKKYEEENFIRLNLTKKQKAQARKLATINTIGDDITRMDDISVLNINNSNDYIRPKNKKSKKKFNQSNKKKRMKRH